MPSLLRLREVVAAELQSTLEGFACRRANDPVTTDEWRRMLDLRAELRAIDSDIPESRTRRSMVPTIGEQEEFINRLKADHDRKYRAANRILDDAREDGRDELSPGEAATFRKKAAEVEGLTKRIKQAESDLGRLGSSSQTLRRLQRKSPGGSHSDSNSRAHAWACQAAERLTGLSVEHRAVVSGSIDVPSLVEPFVIETPWPVRIIDLLVNRQVADSNAYEYFQQTVRTNNAAPVADLATKPTSVFTLAAHTDRCRVVAHLSQPVPYRFLQDQPELQPWLAAEMYGGVMAALEGQIISGNGTGENMLGLLNTSGTTAIAFDTDVPTTIRHSITELQLLGEVPNAIALNPLDAEGIDLIRWGASGGFLTGGYQNDTGNGFGTSDNVFGPTNEIRRVISPSVPQGTAIVADWRQIKIFVREDFVLQLNYLGDNEFGTNSYILRGEGRYGIGVLRPQAFAIAALTSG